MKSHLPIDQKNLRDQYMKANGYLAKTGWKPKQVASKESAQPGTKLWRPSPVELTQVEDTVSLFKIAQAISDDTALLSPDVNIVMTVLRDGLAIGTHVSQEYGKASSLDTLMEQNQRRSLSTFQEAEFNGKLNMTAVINLYVCASYVVYTLGQHKSDQVASIKVDFQGIPEMSLRSPIPAVQCMVYYLGKYWSQSGAVRNELEMIKMTLEYMNAILADIANRKSSLTYTEPFTAVSYQLKGTDFVVDGFDNVQKSVVVSAEFNRVEFASIVGNRRAKHEAGRTAKRLACYDLERKSNPFNELGGTQGVRMGFGKPGTGKSLQIAATATRLKDLCDRRGIPFLFHPMPDNLISTFQGGSGERMLEWMKRFHDDDKVIYGPIDDGENNLEDRTRQGISAGVREVIGVFLRHTEGASAVKRGNYVFEIFTNLPEQIDKAVLSRVQARFPIDGAETAHDFMDQDHLWWRAFEKISKGFVSMEHASGYEFMSDQAVLGSLIDLEHGAKATEFKDERLLTIQARVLRKFKPTDHSFFGELFAEVHKEFPNFTSRDVRNIQQAVNSRTQDFDVPDEWFDKPELFFGKSYETRVEMLRELMRGTMKGLNFGEMRLQETIGYLNNMVIIASADRERAIERIIEDMELRTVAQARYAARVKA